MLSNAALTSLAAKYWDKAPTVIKAPFGVAAPKSEDVFPAVVAACDDVRRGSLDARFYLELRRKRADRTFATLVQAEYDNFPNHEDSSPHSYAQRMAREHDRLYRRILDRESRLVRRIPAAATDRADAHVDGMVLEISETELAAADEYEVDDYRRIAVPLRSGATAWVYVFAG